MTEEIRPKLTEEQADYIEEKKNEGLIDFRYAEEAAWFLSHVDPEWLWEHTEPVDNIEFIRED